MKRKNEFENHIETIIKTYGNVRQEHENLSVLAIKRVKQFDNENKLFTDAGSPYCTWVGKQKRTELVYYSPINNIDWRIECKSRIEPGLLGEIVFELNYVADIPEELFCLVLSDSLMNEKFIKLIETNIREKNLSRKVWVGNAVQFKNFLIMHRKL